MGRYYTRSKSMLSVLFLFSSLLFIAILDISLTVEVVAIFSAFALLVLLVALNEMNGTYMSLATFFAVFSFVMHLGHPFLITLGFDDVLGFDQRGYTTQEVYLQSIQYCVSVHLCLYLGMILGAKKYRIIPKNHIIVQEGTARLSRIYSIGLILFALCLLPRLYMDISKIVLFLGGGYLNTYNTNTSGYIQVIAKILDFAVVLLVIGSQKNPKRAKRWMLGTIIYHGVIMLTGNRGEATLRILILLFIYSKLFPRKKMLLKHKLAIFVIIWCGAGVLNTIGDLRLDGFTAGVLLNKLGDNIFREPAVLKIFSEFGVSIRTVCHSIETFPGREPFSYGSNYVEGLALVFPNIGGIVSSIVRESTYVYYFVDHSTIGGSYIGEMYYAFGQFGCLLALPLGYLISKLDFLREKAYAQKDWKKYAIAILFMAPMLWWIRDYFYNTVREIAWALVLLFVLSKINIVKRYGTLPYTDKSS